MSGVTRTFVLSLAAVFLLVLVVIVVMKMRRGKKSKGSEGDLQEEIKEQIIWRALAQGGRITAAEAASHGGRSPLDVERALLSLVAEGRAQAEAGEEREIVYLVDLGTGSGDE